MHTTNKIPLADLAYRAIRDMVAAGRFGAGEVISEVRLSNELEVSRTPVREAVRRLVGESVLEVTPTGLRIYAPSLEDVAEVYYMRGVLEGSAARLALARDGIVLARKLREILEEARPLMLNDDQDGFTRMNGEFHGAINGASGNRRIQETLASLNGIVVRYRRMSLLFPEHIKRSFEDHQRIVELMEQGKPEAVESLVRDHIFCAGARVVRATSRMSGMSPNISPTADTLLAIEAQHPAAEGRKAT